MPPSKPPRRPKSRAIPTPRVPLAAVPALAVARLEQMSEQRRQRLIALHTERLTLNRRPEERIALPPSPEALADMERTGHPRLVAVAETLIELAGRMEQPFLVRAAQEGAFPVLELDMAARQAMMEEVLLGGDLARHLRAEAEARFGRDVPMVAGPRGPVVDIHRLLRHSTGLSWAVMAAATWSEQLWAELLRRERLTARSGLAPRSLPDHVIRLLDPRLAAALTGQRTVTAEHLDRLAWRVIGEAFSTHQRLRIEGDAADWARRQPALARLGLGGSVTGVPPALLATVERVTGEMSERVRRVLDSPRPGGLGIDLDHFLASGGAAERYIADPSSILAQLRVQHPGVPDVRLVAHGRTLLATAIDRGQLPATAGVDDYLFGGAGLSLDDIAGFRVQTIAAPRPRGVLARLLGRG